MEVQRIEGYTTGTGEMTKRKRVSRGSVAAELRGTRSHITRNVIVLHEEHVLQNNARKFGKVMVHLVQSARWQDVYYWGGSDYGSCLVPALVGKKQIESCTPPHPTVKLNICIGTVLLFGDDNAYISHCAHQTEKGVFDEYAYHAQP